MNPLKIIQKYYKPQTKLYRTLVRHSQNVTKKALAIAKNYQGEKLDLKFIEESAMLHDIGIFLTNAPDIGCFGEEHYLRHGYWGGKILRKEGLMAHARVCERHLGVGLTKAEIIKNKIPLPKKDFVPKTTAEEIVCLADLFYSKKANLNQEKTLAEIRSTYQKYGRTQRARLEKLIKKYL